MGNKMQPVRKILLVNCIFRQMEIKLRQEN